jgi:ABC-2 type transport system ATP-binding protein
MEPQQLTLTQGQPLSMVCMTTRTNAIEVAGLRKSYGDHEVVAGVDLTVPAGTVYALLGPNGAGKTTTVRILSTLLPAGTGEVRVAGHDIRREADQVRTSIGVTGQFSAVDELLNCFSAAAPG